MTRRGSSEKIAAVVSVRDEAELVLACVDHLELIGVDAIVVCDKGSTDGTLAVASALQEAGRIDLIELGDENDLETWADVNLRHIRSLGADWVIFLDADELLLTSEPDIHESASLARGDVLSIQRYNVPLISGEPGPLELLQRGQLAELPLIVDPAPPFTASTGPEMSWILSRIAPRALARPAVIESLPLGGHDVIIKSGTEARRAPANDLLVAHLPFTTRDRFVRKVQNIRRVLELHDDLFGDHSGHHWRRWAAIPDGEPLEREFQRMVLPASLRASSMIKSARSVLRSD